MTLNVNQKSEQGVGSALEIAEKTKLEKWSLLSVLAWKQLPKIEPDLILQQHGKKRLPKGWCICPKEWVWFIQQQEKKHLPKEW
jgi:hypothetical protein